MDCGENQTGSLGSPTMISSNGAEISDGASSPKLAPSVGYHSVVPCCSVCVWASAYNSSCPVSVATYLLTTIFFIQCRRLPDFPALPNLFMTCAFSMEMSTMWWKAISSMRITVINVCTLFDHMGCASKASSWLTMLSNICTNGTEDSSLLITMIMTRPTRSTFREAPMQSAIYLQL